MKNIRNCEVLTCSCLIYVPDVVLYIYTQFILPRPKSWLALGSCQFKFSKLGWKNKTNDFGKVADVHPVHALEMLVYIIIYLTNTYEKITIDIIIVYVSIFWIPILIFIIFVNVKIKILATKDYFGHQPLRKKPYSYTNLY